MSWKNNLKNIIDGITEKYARFKESKSRLISDMSDIFQYAAYSVNNFDGVNNSTSNTSYRFDKNNMYTKDVLRNIYTIRNDIDSIEKIVLNRFHTPERLSQIIYIKNKYFWKDDAQLQDLIQRDAGIFVSDVSSLIKDAMILKVNNPKYSSITSIYYDSRIASQEMKNEFILGYTSKEVTLKEISLEFEKKYGMHISASTISRNARNYLRSQGLDFKNRREAKKYYKNASVSNGIDI